MKKKYRVALVVLGCLIVLIGFSYAYFLATSKLNGTGVVTTANTVTLDNVGFNIEGSLEFNDLDVLPGHKNVSKIKVTAIGNDDAISYKLVWEGTNTINTPLKYYVYKTTSDETPSVACTKKTEQSGFTKIMYETCEDSNFENLGGVIATGEITKTSEAKEFVLVNDEVIKGTSEGNIIYYYVVLEYPNLDELQNIDMGGAFTGQVTVKKTEDSLADITIMKMYQETDSGYQEIKTMPSEGYVINGEKSTCTNSAVPTVSNGKVLVTNLTINGTECNLYFDIPASTQTLKKLGLTATEGTDSFTGPSTSNEEIKTGTDDDGTTYYYRGAVTNNWVKFADSYWRIIRINGDGTIRMIYQGKVSDGVQTVGEKTQLQTSAYNTSINDNAYVGYMYGSTGQTDSETGYTNTHKNTNNSTIKGIVDNWYKTNIVDANLDDKVDKNAGFCNDRKVYTGASWNGYGTTGYGVNPTTYEPINRVIQWSNGNSSNKTIQTPTFKCSQNNDLFTSTTASKGNKALHYPVGLITMDEVIYAGGFWGQGSSSYYLYTNQTYWTMSPSNFNYYAASYYAYVFYVNSSGNLRDNNTNNTYGVRPVINLKADTEFKAGGDGTSSNPYVVEGAE